MNKAIAQQGYAIAMQKLIRPGFLAAVLIILVAGAFIGVSAADGGGGNQIHNDCEMNHASEECEMNYEGEDCPMMDGGMMGGMMNMGNDCPMEQRGGMMGMHDDSTASRDNCAMN